MIRIQCKNDKDKKYIIIEQCLLNYIYIGEEFIYDKYYLIFKENGSDNNE